MEYYKNNSINIFRNLNTSFSPQLAKQRPNLQTPIFPQEPLIRIFDRIKIPNKKIPIKNQTLVNQRNIWQPRPQPMSICPSASNSRNSQLKPSHLNPKTIIDL